MDLRLLVVDDEAQILELLDLTLTLHGFAVVTASSGPDALQAATAAPFDVIVLDVLMTPWDGFETVRRLHGALGDRLPPVVFLSGLSRASAPLPPVVAEYLVKPFRPSQLVEAIGRVARGARRN
ncbi:response regulator [Deinococcus hopiensis]|uniref:Response regulator containing CheY-like receiver, AAA-type ATPase, and DNA-binding domains n=1 Tax=Deinococcus hopiensis KR-140 TaxID=695939 RepID=A0A1W1VHT2_9DEIO|nr:response regulator [Deinococcus hopiensis]SMB92514.1 Response regulator containing CheY-like receiver, AAA-type ATPase, and DNA-binding domains [Deinococcus hopiensis KR-140]